MNELLRWGGILEVEHLERELCHPPQDQLEALIAEMTKLDLVDVSVTSGKPALSHLPARIDHMRRWGVKLYGTGKLPEPHLLYPDSPSDPALCPCGRCNPGCGVGRPHRAVRLVSALHVTASFCD
jgi:hypothetical protein